jgi:hypothetical protein
MPKQIIRSTKEGETSFVYHKDMIDNYVTGLKQDKELRAKIHRRAIRVYKKAQVDVNKAKLSNTHRLTVLNFSLTENKETPKMHFQYSLPAPYKITLLCVFEPVTWLKA